MHKVSLYKIKFIAPEKLCISHSNYKAETLATTTLCTCINQKNSGDKLRKREH